MELILSAFLLLPIAAFGGNQARNAGLPVGTLYPPGKHNLISDVPGVSVGHITLISGNGPLKVGQGPVRTGVTVVIPSKEDIWNQKLLAGAHILNGNGEATGLMWLQESGVLETPIGLTNTLSVADVQKALVKFTIKKHPEVPSLMPVVLECDDSSLSDIHGFHVKTEHVDQAIQKADSLFEEGSVGAGTGMISFNFKSGIGSASRVVAIEGKSFRLGLLVNSNIGTGTRQIFSLGGINIGKKITDLMPIEKDWKPQKGAGSAVFIIATDAPLLPLQLRRLSERAFLGLGRLGTVGYNGSGEIAIAFSTANKMPEESSSPSIRLQALTNSNLNNLFEAVVEAAEEAVLNSLVASHTMTGRDGNKVYRFPTERWKEIARP